MRILVTVLAALVLVGCKKDAKSTEGGNVLNAPTDYLGGLNQAKKVAEKTVDLASLKNAIALFHGQEDRYPKDLDELVKGRYIQKVPEASRGMRVVYNPTTGDVGVVKE